ncbi:MAG: glycerol dehydrogenase [Planctomycetes bacterium]|nr:glycerol dehydrogenase [Planctomycetota bacterium]
MKTVFIAPRRYVQGRGVLRECGTLLKAIGRKPLLLWDARVKAAVGPAVLGGLAGSGLDAIDVEFGGQTTREEAERVAKIAREQGADIVVAVGGGKTLDAAKAAAHQAGTKMVTVPTIASTDSPTSSYTVWYDDAGACLGFESWGVNPDLVLVDTEVIVRAPVRSFVAGMGDALSTWIEADACHRARKGTLAGDGQATMLAMAIARLCYDTVMTHGLEAMRAVERHLVTPAVEKVVEANVLLSGLGFENGGVATGHMVANSLPAIPECKGLMHGEEVGFGIITQLCLDEDVDPAEKHRIVDFEIAVGLPVTFADINLEGVTRDRLKPIGDICGSKGSLCENHPFRITAEDVIDAMIDADALGRARKKARGSPEWKE